MPKVNIYEMTDTWNEAGTEYTGIRMDVTDTASDAESKLLDLLVGNVSQFAIRKDGAILGAFESAPGLSAALGAHPLLSEATMLADFRRGAYAFCAPGENLRACKFSDLVDFTRAGEAARTTITGALETVAANEPRIEYDPATGERIGMLIEKSRTNYLPQSADLSDAAWETVQSSVSSASATKGSGNAWLLTENTDSGAHVVSIFGISGIAPDQTITAQVKLKANGRTEIRVSVYGDTDSNRIDANFDLSAGSVSSTADVGTAIVDGATIKHLGDDWYLCTVTGQPSTGTASGLDRFRIWLTDGGTGSYTGDGTSGVYIMDPQIEAGSFATSYIETNGSAITRADEIVSLKQVGTWLRQGVGTLIVRARSRIKRPASVVGLARLSDASGSGLIRLSSADDSDNHEAQIVSDAGSTVFDDGVTEANSGSDLVTMTTSAIAWDSAGAIVAADGHANSEDTSVTLPTGLDEAALGDGSEAFVWIEWAAFIPRKLSSSELQSITG